MTSQRAQLADRSGAEPSALPDRRVKSRVRAAGLHLLGSAALAGVGAFSLVRLWYPYPFATLAGGIELLVILLCVDIVLGPLLTLVAASPGKLIRVLARDVTFIVSIQFVALGYGIHVLAQARPIGVVFEVDQMRVVAAADVDPAILSQAPAQLRELSWTGPRPFAAVKPTDSTELLKAIQLGMSGVDLAMLPSQWREYETQVQEVLARSKPVQLLVQQYPEVATELESLAQSAGTTVAQLRFLPLRSRKAADWVTIIAQPDARIVGHLHKDGYF